MLHLATVDTVTLELLRQIQQDPIFSDTRLVGGTALALQMGHRKSVDLDFFGTLRLEPLEIEQTLRAYGPVSLTSRSRMIQAYSVQGVKVDLVFLLDQFSLNDLLSFYQRKYVEASLFLVMKSLTYFDDAEEDPMPHMLKPCDWNDAKRRIVRSVTDTQRDASNVIM